MSSFKIYAPQDWWSKSVNLLTLSSESSRDSSGEDSFLSCTLINVDNGEVFLESESSISTTFINVDDLDIEGEGKCLINTQKLASCLKSMPSDTNINFIYNEETKKITIESDDSNHIKFNVDSFNISNEDAVPKAVDMIPEDASSIVVSGRELAHNYRIASSMAKTMDKDASAGQDPLSGCTMNITDEGLQLFSLANSSAETLIKSDNITLNDDNVTLLSSPDITTPRLGAFSNEDELTLSIQEGKRLYLSTDEAIISFSALNIGNMKNKITIDLIKSVLDPAWDNRIVSVHTPSKEFFASLSRISTVNAEKALINITSTNIKISGVTSGETLFSQDIPSTVEWVDTEKASELLTTDTVEVGIIIDSVKKIASSVSKNDNLIFDISYKDNGKPWTMIVYHDDEYNAENPHDFFMLMLL